ncbi:MAG: response regulator [Desulfovibrionaceae bacterium]|nr:response regulator [Desulfovibrionaceae bacterium]
MQNKDIRILIVDDSPSMRKVAAGALRRLGMKNLEQAPDGESAWRRIELGGVDLVICDQQMPGLKGIDLLSRVRGSDEYKDLPFIIVTGYSFADNVIEAAKRGVTDYIVKPFSSNSLNEKISRLFSSRKSAE